MCVIGGCALLLKFGGSVVVVLAVVVPPSGTPVDVETFPMVVLLHDAEAIACDAVPLAFP